MSDVITPQVRDILEGSIVHVLMSKGVSMPVSTKTASEILLMFNDAVYRYMEEMITNQQLAVVQEALKQIH
jgi:hypothetical protein